MFWEAGVINMNYVVIDLEMCNSSINGRNFYEIIQIGAVILNSKYKIIDQFNTLVKPRYGKVNTFIKKLTGISNGKLHNAPEFETAINDFLMWIPENEEVRCVSWSDSDMIQIRKEMALKNYYSQRMKELFNTWIDCQILFGEKLEMKNRTKLEDALMIFDISPEGRLHDGFYDAYNTALLYAKLQTEKEFKMNEIYKSARFEEKTPMVFCIGDLLSKCEVVI